MRRPRNLSIALCLLLALAWFASVHLTASVEVGHTSVSIRSGGPRVPIEALPLRSWR